MRSSRVASAARVVCLRRGEVAEAGRLAVAPILRWAVRRRCMVGSPCLAALRDFFAFASESYLTWRHRLAATLMPAEARRLRRATLTAVLAIHRGRTC